MSQASKRRTEDRSPASTSQSSDDDSDEHQSKRLRSSSQAPSDQYATRPLRIFIVGAKLDPQTNHDLHEMIENSDDLSGTSLPRMEVCGSIANSDVIVTGIRMRKRLERHLDWSVAQHKSIVTPSWLEQSINHRRLLPCGDFAALSELRDETVEHCPDKSEEDQSQRPQDDAGSPPDVIPTTRPTDPSVFENWKSRYACTRASPLTCPNQGLVEELNVLYRDRDLEGLDVNALAYERAIGILKSYPFPITKQTYSRDVVKLPGFGEKILSKIQEYMSNGFISESRDTRNSQRYKSLNLFCTIYGIGPSNARKLYDVGLRTMEDLERYYDVPPGADITSLQESQTAAAEPVYTPNGRLVPSSVSKDGGTGRPSTLSIKVALVLREEFEVKIPREEVEEMHRVVMRELAQIQRGCVSTIVGGYRRGKQESNDVDIVISHSDLKGGGEAVKGLATKLTKQLYERGLVTHVMHLSGFHAHDALRTKQWDSLEKALTVFILPPSPSDGVPSGSDSNAPRPRLHRRLDLIFASPEAYWTAVIGWSGSKMFERDLRLWAKQEKGMKFDSSGLSRRRDSKFYTPRSEEDVFELLGLKWIDPTMRNADA